MVVVDVVVVVVVVSSVVEGEKERAVVVVVEGEDEADDLAFLDMWCNVCCLPNSVLAVTVRLELAGTSSPAVSESSSDERRGTGEEDRGGVTSPPDVDDAGRGRDRCLFE